MNTAKRRSTIIVGYLIFNAMAPLLAFVALGIAPMLHIQLAFPMALLLSFAVMGHLWWIMLIIFGGAHGKAQQKNQD